MLQTYWTQALANHLWQSTVLIIAAWLLTFALRKNQAHSSLLDLAGCVSKISCSVLPAGCNGPVHWVPDRYPRFCSVDIVPDGTDDPTNSRGQADRCRRAFGCTAQRQSAALPYLLSMAVRIFCRGLLLGSGMAASAICRAVVLTLAAGGRRARTLLPVSAGARHFRHCFAGAFVT